MGIVLDGVDYAVMGRPILQGISLALDEPRIGIVGRNGSGKTTLLRLIAGLVAPTTGRVAVDGIDPARDRKGVLRRLGILFQNPDHQILFPTVAEELAFGLRQMGQEARAAEAAVMRLLEAEGRAHWAGSATSTLSQGQKQYLCLQAVLMMEPGTILLDEPFAALDLPTRARMARRLSSLAQRLVTISHDPEAVVGCDRVIWIEAGRVFADGTANEVLPAFQDAMQRLGAGDADIDIAG
ncbi:ABC transporter ATP-binding protein [Aliigemmobacter aestuarii]|uniref:ABC transporter ATP-binding protein n=1 Tax=Aliigemmobacter aestuarii TaxID=1445661 RepID=A0A4S3MKS3_9RHOB|nr:ABC transporter ATP-binding protein [Gemmobacter aestuarii]THD82150.1 ABC transporter ATP-binding protein [Gemmobacter aestuarii]